MKLTREEIDDIAGRLDEMTGNVRSVENPNIPVNPAQLDALAGYGPTRSGVQINESSAMTFVAVFAAIKVLAESVAMLPMGVYQGDDSDVRVRATWHPADKLLSREPNPDMPPVVFKETVQQWTTAWGNGYARVEFDNKGRPAIMRPLDSSRTKPERVAGQVRYTVAGGGGTFAAEEIVHIRSFSGDGLQAISPIANAREAIAMGKAAELFGAGFFGNGATLGGVIEHPKALSPEAIRNLRDGFSNMHAGVGNAWKTGVLEEGASYKPIGSLPAQDALFIDARKFQVTEVARIFRLPPHMLADQDRSTHSNIEQAGLEFLIYTLSPWILKWEEELTRKLCEPNSGYHVRVDVKSLLRLDTNAKQLWYIAGRQWGWLSVNDIRREEGLPPIPGGDTYLQPMNMQDVNPANRPPLPAAGAAGGAGASGGALPAPAPAAAAAMRSVFADAITRMLRKESNAAANGKANDRFYYEHAGHVRDALMPATMALCQLAGVRDTVTAIQFVDELARQRHEHVNGNAPALADQQAQDLMQKITALRGSE